MLRSLLFVPADSSRKIAKAKDLNPDSFIFDLEDAVAPDRKVEARAQLGQLLQNFQHSHARLFVRVNPPGSEFLKDDLDVAVSQTVDGIVLPKSENRNDIVSVAETIGRLEEEKALSAQKTSLLLLIETAGGIVRAFDLARCSQRVTALIFGAEDYCSDMGLRRTKAGQEINYARSVVAHAAHATRLQAIDTVYTDLRDIEGLAQETRQIQRMGFTGKLLIHPRQIEPVHAQFAPRPEEIAWAQRVLEAFQVARTQSSGLAVVDGKMVDEPIFRQARTILDRASRPANETNGPENPKCQK